MIWSRRSFVEKGDGSMNYRAIDIAKYILRYCTEQNRPISNLKLQKMLYFIWMDFYKETGRDLFRDEFCAWQLGPVIPDVYDEYCAYAGMPIIATCPVEEINSQDRRVLDSRIEKYIPISASALVDRAHQPDTPWSLIYKGPARRGDVIPFSRMKEWSDQNDNVAT